MPRSLRVQFPGAFYHVMSRGNEKQNIFNNHSDKERFLEYLKKAVINYEAVIHCYCLMDNHYHLLIETPKGNISRIMQYINGAYTTFFNTKWDRVGHLFQGRYKSILIDEDQYLLELSRYIHLNPVRAGYVERPEQYSWSSYLYLISENQRISHWLNREFLLQLFDPATDISRHRYQLFVEDKIGKEYNIRLFENEMT